jgi:hypothetical protein
MAADLIENYEQHMAPFQFIKDVPADWSESRVLNGEIGDFVTIARKDRRSENWYLGAVSDEESRVLEVPLSFLTPGKRYRAQIYRDGPNAHYRTNAKDHRDRGADCDQHRRPDAPAGARRRPGDPLRRAAMMTLSTLPRCLLLVSRNAC